MAGLTENIPKDEVQNERQNKFCIDVKKTAVKHGKGFFFFF